MTNNFLERSDYGVIIFFLIVISTLLYLSPPILNEASNIGSYEEIDARTRPVGQVQIAEQIAENQISDVVQENDKGAGESEVVTITSGEKSSPNTKAEDLAKASCFTCHQTGLLDAPKVGNRSDWEKRLEQGFDVLVLHAQEGFNNMPARGGNPDLSDTEIENALLFMLAQSEITVPGKIIESLSSENTETEDAVTNPDESTPVESEQIDIKEEVALTEPKPQTEEPGNQAGEEVTSPPVAVVNMPSPGKDLYDNACASCHENGSNKSPRVGEQNEWIASMAKGTDALTKLVAEGPPSHPKFSESELTDIQIRNAIEYIMQQTYWPSFK